MQIPNTEDENMAFEAWAQLLISRKVPENYRHLIDPDLVSEGAAILKRGDAFEVYVSGWCMEVSKSDAEPPCLSNSRILVAPFPA